MMKDAIARIAKGVGVLAVLGLLVYVGIKTSIVQIYLGSDEEMIYSYLADTGERITMALKGNEIIVMHTISDDNSDNFIGYGIKYHVVGSRYQQIIGQVYYNNEASRIGKMLSLFDNDDEHYFLELNCTQVGDTGCDSDVSLGEQFKEIVSISDDYLISEDNSTIFNRVLDINLVSEIKRFQKVLGIGYS